MSSISWFGALLVFLAHSVASLVSRDPNLVRSVCVAMGLTAWFVILPLSLASSSPASCRRSAPHGPRSALLGGRRAAATTSATAILLLKLSHQRFGRGGSASEFPLTAFMDLKQSLLVHSVGGVLVLLLITVLAVYKPAGVTPFAGREHHVTGQNGIPSWARSSLIIVAALALVVALLLMHGGHGPAMGRP